MIRQYMTDEWKSTQVNTYICVPAFVFEEKWWVTETTAELST